MTPLSVWIDALTESTREVAVTSLGFDDISLEELLAGLPEAHTGVYLPLHTPSGPVQIALMADIPGCRSLAGALLGMDETEELGDADVADAVGEVLNIVAGSLKTRIQEHERPVQLGLPMYVVGHVFPQDDIEGMVAKVKVGAIPAELMVLRQRIPPPEAL